MRTFQVTVNGVPYQVDVEEVAAGQAVPQAAKPAVAAPQRPPRPSPAAPAAPAAAKSAAPIAGGHQVKSPMPGTILDVRVKAGDAVKKGQVLCILEAMKMENEILAPSDGSVAQVVAAKGASVNSGDVLLVVN